MTNQMQGELLFGGWEGGAGDAGWAVTPWMPVRGDYATFAVEVIASSGTTVDWLWEVQTRTSEDPSVTVTVIATGAIGATGVLTSQLNTVAAKEWVRYRFKTGSTASTTAFAILRALAPSWQVNR
jgi:hypothetical protein